MLILKITLYNVCAVPWGVLSTVRVFSTMGDILSTMRVFSTVGAYHDKCGGYLEYRGVFTTLGDIMSTMGVILSTMGDVQYHGGIS